MITSRKKAHALSTALFLLGIAALAVIQVWWPGIMLAVGLPLALRQYLLGRQYDTIVTLTIFVGVFVTVQFDISWQVFLPTLLTLGALYILAKEFLVQEPLSEEEKEEDTQHEIEEDKK